MEHQDFDGIAKNLATSGSRRHALKVMLGGLFGVTVAAKSVLTADAKDDDRNERDDKRRRKPDCCPESYPQLCGLTCTDPGSDPNNCGRCGRVCPSGVCRNGACTAPAPFCPMANCNDNNPCTTDSCNEANRACVHTPVANGTACPGGTCDANGLCVPTPFCATAMCDDGNPCTLDKCNEANRACEHTPVASGTACPGGTCDASGTCIPTSLCSGVNCDDGNPCTVDSCNESTGTCIHTPVASGTSCTGGTCNSNGVCVPTGGCATAADCPGPITECARPICNAGVCGTGFSAAGQLLTTQTKGDCKLDVCDGAGNVIQRIDDGDVPVSIGQCSRAICVAGVPSNPAVAAGTACNENGGSICDGAGACVQCLLARDCSVANTECATATCVAGLCGQMFASSGTSCTGGTCNGNGVCVA